MNREITLHTLTELKFFAPGTIAQTKEFYRLVLSQEPRLSLADILTIKDLTELSGYHDLELHALLFCMFLAINEGSICIRFSEDSFRKKLAPFLPDDGSEKLAKDIVAKDPAKRYPELISGIENDYKPIIFKKIADDPFLYFQKYPGYEKRLKECLVRLIKDNAESKGPQRDEARDVLEHVLNKDPITKNGKPIELNDEQKRAASLSLLKNFVIISGGPGTGKTSIVITLLRCLVRLKIRPENIKIAAPTGRAAERLADSIRQGLASIAKKDDPLDRELGAIKESTIHRLLRYNPTRNMFSYDPQNYLPADVLILDEVSMIDIVLMAKLFSALKPGTKVILLGDKDQLPSVEAGAVLAHLIPGEEDAVLGHTLLADRVVILKKSYRSEESILEIARSVNAGDETVVERMPLLKIEKKIIKKGGPGSDKRQYTANWPRPELSEGHMKCSGGGCIFIEANAGDVEEWHGVLDAWIVRRFFCAHETRQDIKDTYQELIRRTQILGLGSRSVDDKDGILENMFAFIEQGKLLTFIRRSLFGTFYINRYISRRVRSEFDATSRTGFFAGMPIMITENDPVHELYNGDVGIILKTQSGGYRALFRKPGGYMSIPVSELPVTETSFAITVHKSQGSEYDIVFLVLPHDEKNRLLSKEIVYTALSRARYLVSIYGSKDVLRRAIGRKIERESGIQLWK